MSRFGRRATFWLPPFLYMAAIYYASSQPEPVPQLKDGWDKVVHLLAYAGLAILFLRAFLAEGLRLRPAFWAAILLASAYGASDEYHQLFVPMRHADLQDWIVDTIGAWVGAIGYMLQGVRRRFSRA